jgi:hypothetical protein
MAEQDKISLDLVNLHNRIGKLIVSDKRIEEQILSLDIYAEAGMAIVGELHKLLKPDWKKLMPDAGIAQK